jgi:nitroreductase
MDNLAFLQSRVSVSKVAEPAPSNLILHEVFRCAVRAADHGMLQPRRFLVVSGDGLHRLSQVFVAAAMRAHAGISPSVLEKIRNMPYRAPMIIVAIVTYQEHPKIPKQEQLIACGASVQNVLNAFFSLGYGAVWRTGEMAYDAFVKAELGVKTEEEIIGFVYVGTPVQPFAKPQEVDIHTIYKAWPAE